MEWRYSKSRGPGGQHVNKVETKAELLFTLNKGWINEQIFNRLMTVQGPIIRIKSDEERSQVANRQKCLEKLKALILKAAREAVPAPTLPEQLAKVEVLYASKALRLCRKRRFKEKRLMEKKYASKVKQDRMVKF